MSTPAEPTASESAAPESSPPAGRLIRRGFAIICHHVRLHPMPFVTAMVGALVYALATIGSSMVIGRVVDEVIRPRFEQGEVARGAVIGGALAIVGVGLIKSAGIICRRISAWVLQAGVQATMRERIVNQFLRLPLSFFQTRPTGDLISRAGADVEAATMVMAPLPWATGVVVLLVVAAGWMIVTDLFLAAVGLVLLPSLLTLNVLFQREMEQPANIAQERLGQVSGVAYESIDGAVVVKAFGAEDAEGERFGVAARSLRDAKIDFAKLQATFDALLNGTPAIGIVAILVIGAWRVDQGSVTPGTLVAFASLLNLVAMPLRLVGWVLGDLPRTIAGFDRVTAVLNEPPAPTLRPARARGRGLRVEGLTYAHEDGTPALSDVSFSLRPGVTAALVGPTGCGKSTLLEVIAGLAEPSAGTVTADEPVALAFQEPFVFADSVDANIALGRRLPAGVYEDAVLVSQAAEFIERLPDGPSSRIGERGATLSGGQRQRLALARALARSPRVLLLDDATSSVDPSTESDILKALASRRGETTVLMVATRPSTIALADEVLFMEAGRVIAAGPHSALLASTPRYADLVHAYEAERAGGRKDDQVDGAA